MPESLRAEKTNIGLPRPLRISLKGLGVYPGLTRTRQVV